MNSKNVVLGTLIAPSLPVHESGHAFCGLEDEYKFDYNRASGYPNCFSSTGISNGFGDYGSPYLICESSNRYRTSYCSIMGCGDESKTIRDNIALRPEKFNLWDCGVCLSKIDSKGTLKENAQYCRNNSFDVVNIDGKPNASTLECSNNADCENKKDIKWDPGCIDYCVANKCVSAAGQSCTFIVKNSNGTIANGADGKCGSKEASTEGRCLQIKYSCVKSTGECVEDVNGIFSSVNSCKPGCPKPPQKYSCDAAKGTCVQDNNGQWESPGSCAVACPKP